MATSTTGAVRYSTANVSKSDSAQSFSWESPVPVNEFWDSISYCPARNFLDNFTEQELASLPIDPDSTSPNEEKFSLLLHLFQEKFAKFAKEETTPPRTPDDHNRWSRLLQAIYTMQSELGQIDEAGKTIHLIVDNRSDRSNLAPMHMLADHLFREGKYAEAEATERPVCAWMDAHEKLGRDSPQAINARRIIARALWNQGATRRAEVEALVEEIKGIVEGMAPPGGRFAVYQEEERELNAAMMAELQAWEEDLK
ncbi:hypothetical protein B0H66DRAFT_560003 [Apodospora peruviana]|uniref:Uncharacterized protein n=1 Tax=Apodospora peruviana TaxID=516989 RepID=A0AAE0I033_9PEZI|nr:hypothetical protein B0H66DRAFT_560003 [Apodospora peruviana]